VLFALPRPSNTTGPSDLARADATSDRRSAPSNGPAMVAAGEPDAHRDGEHGVDVSE
jgi:hypothetical protein